MACSRSTVPCRATRRRVLAHVYSVAASCTPRAEFLNVASQLVLPKPGQSLVSPKSRIKKSPPKIKFLALPGICGIGLFWEGPAATAFNFCIHTRGGRSQRPFSIVHRQDLPSCFQLRTCCSLVPSPRSCSCTSVCVLRFPQGSQNPVWTH